MVKRLIGFILCITLVASLSISPAFAAAKATTVNAALSNAKITFNGQNLMFKGSDYKLQQPVSYQGTTYVPLRTFANELGLQVVYDAKTNAIDLQDKYDLVDLQSSLLKSYPTFNNGVSFTKTDEGNIIKINRNQLPSSMKEFKKIMVSGIEENTISTISYVLFSLINNHSHAYNYDDNTGFASGNFQPFELIVLFDSADNVLGYNVLIKKETANNPKSVKVSNVNSKILVQGKIFEPKDSKNKLIPFLNYEGNTYVPLRNLAEALNIQVSYDSKMNTIKLIRDSNINDVKPLLLSFKDKYKSFDCGVHYNIKKDGIQIKVDRTELPESMRDFEKISVAGIRNTSDKEVAESLYYHIFKKNGIFIYDDKTGFGTGNPGQYDVVTLYDGNENILGYYVLTINFNDEPVNIIVDNPVDATPKGILNYPSFTGAMTLIGNVPKHFQLKIDRNKLPDSMKNFTQIRVSGSDDISVPILIKYFLGPDVKLYGISRYNDQEGKTVTNFNPNNRFMNPSFNVIMLYDDNDKILGYSVIKIDD